MPVYQKKPVNTDVKFGSAANIALQTLSSSERLQQRLAGARGAVEKYAEPQITDETVAKALKDVEDGNIDSKAVAMVAQNVYRDTANRALIADIDVDGHKLGNDILSAQKARNNYNVSSFSKSWDAYSKGMMGGIKDIALRESIGNRLAKSGERFRSQIATLQASQVNRLRKNSLNAQLDLHSRRLNAAYGVSNEEALKIQADVAGTLQAMVNSNYISQNGAFAKGKKISAEAYMANMQRGLTNAINTGQSHKFYDEFKKADHGGIITLQEVEKFRASIHSQVSHDLAIYSNEQKLTEAEFKAVEYQTTQDFNDKLMQGDLMQNDVDNALATNQIDLATHGTYTTKLQDGGKLVDDTQQLLFTRSHVLDISEETIMDSPHFKDNTKWDLIKQRRAEVADETNWLSTQSGRESRRRIKESFNIFEGTLMGKMDFNNQNTKDYDAVYRSFYAEVESLPLEQRASKSMSIADKHLTAYAEKKEQKKEAKAQAKIKKKEDEEAEAEKAYNDSVTGKFMNMFKSEKKSDFDLLQEQFD